MKINHVLLVFLSLITNAFSAEYLIRFKNTKASLDLPENAYSIRNVSKELNVQKIKLQNLALLKKIKNNPNIEFIIPNTPFQQRAIEPNDLSYAKQWSLQFQKGKNQANINIGQAWDITTGGENSLGNEIVVAIIDNGFDHNHEDLIENRWVNNHEIPNNGIDDDGNGYVDDVYGWNANTNSGSLGSAVHGTHVAGIIGARGDNIKGISGVNWNVKLMYLDVKNYRPSTVLKAYDYIIKMKKLWIESDGQKGANIVVTNNSFGYDRADCEAPNYKIWNETFNAMGKIGILSAAATANRGWNVDQVGDVPTACASNYIIAVTNTTKNDKKFSSAAWGKQHIDLGAPGTNIYSTIPGNNYRHLDGTSMATPHVAGAIALMHAAAPIRFSNHYRSNPAKAALMIKEILLKSVKPISDLKAKTVSDGRLNLGKAVQNLQNYKDY